MNVSRPHSAAFVAGVKGVTGSLSGVANRIECRKPTFWRHSIDGSTGAEIHHPLSAAVVCARSSRKGLNVSPLRGDLIPH
jgi:hypothetical protein